MYEDISIEDFRARFESGDSGDFQFIDVREQEEYAAAHIPGVINIPMTEFMARIDEISEDEAVVLVCNTGIRSAQAAMFMVSMGYEDIINLEDGTKGWMKKGYAIESETLE